MTVAPCFHEDWFADFNQTVLAWLAGQVADVDGLIIEIGCWEGRSTVCLANAINPRVVQAVDTWAGSPGEVSAELAAGRDIFAQWAANVEAFTNGNVVPHWMGWREYLPTVVEPVALAFIDAEHSFTEVFDNLQAVLPMLASGGIVCGDDSHHPPVQSAVLALLPDANVKGAVWWWKKP